MTGIFGIMTGKAAFLVCLASTLLMSGLIWFVQVVHYPLFAKVDPKTFTRFHEEHARMTTRVVLVPMVLELVSSVLLILQRPAELDPTLAWAGLVAAGGSWLSTILLQVQRHERLARGFDPSVHRTLVSTNILRTACWTAHAAILLVRVARLFL